ncbi:MAG: type I restriction enzyme S subunit [Cyclobacteriaceae bacterium]|jgi:type I restriction enzyme S subunit
MEQLAIVGKVEAMMKKRKSLELAITQTEQHAQMLMQVVLKEAFEGKTVDKSKQEVEV